MFGGIGRRRPGRLTRPLMIRAAAAAAVLAAVAAGVAAPGTGAIAAPPLASLAMRAFGPSALFAQNAIVHGALAGFAVWRLALDPRSKVRGRRLNPWRP